MRLPPFEKYTKGLQMFGMLLLGMVVGAVVYNSLYQAQFEALISLKSELEIQLEQYEQDISNLKEFKHQHTVIKSILPRIELEAGQNAGRPQLDKMTEAELIRRIKADLSVFIGQSIYEIDSNAQFARKLLSKRVYNEVLEKDYEVEVKTMLVVDNVLQLWVKVRLHDRGPS
ncbi:hypothetical protein SAMN04487969_103139 [Paenibacillus algorifonticola]|uniref:Sporulation membrane protein YtrI C-terminal domain-containing protein n=1 Tax=Paenibacillus algorifonticola TaxID=684063 RepID=A0A1I2B545_9BACL|nr:hypothetical protein [Paenibacillus algorifonticola]SFE51018.1 hypothetical protein SAMN04487969_103139 [Paenibacillus algorifonticola]